MPQLPGVTHQHVSVNGFEMHVATAGDDKAEPVMLLHGWPQNWWTWRKLIGPLSERYRVIVPDHRGFGWSEAPPTGYLKSDLADDALALADALGVDQLRLAGHDWGGMAGFHMCIKQPERITHYAAMGTAHLWPDADPGVEDRLRLASRIWFQFLLATPGVGRQLTQRVPAFVRTLLKEGSSAPGTFTDEDLDIFVSQWREPERAAAGHQVYKTFIGTELRQLASGAYADKTAAQPIVMLNGGDDPVIQTENLVGAEANMPNAEIRELAGVGHFVPEEGPEEVLAALLELYAS